MVAPSPARFPTMLIPFLIKTIIFAYADLANLGCFAAFAGSCNQIMSVLFPLLILPLAALTLIFLGAIWLVNALSGQVVGNKHRILEAIVNQGEIPEQWRNDWVSRLLNSFGGEEQRQARLRKRVLRKLDELLRYVHTTSLLADEETRDVLVERLTEVRAEWLRRKLDHP